VIVEAVVVNTSADDGSSGWAGYRRSARSPRGEARRRELLDRVTEDLAVNGLVDFSLRRAARAADTTHKVLLYHFDGVDDLLRQAILRLRDRRTDNALAAARETGAGTLASRVRAMWPMISGDSPALIVLDQAIGLAMYDSERYGWLGREVSREYLTALMSVCPPHWGDQRKLEVAEMILGVFRGFLVELRTNGDSSGIAPGLAALSRALDREEAAEG
jgi:AcrR family transcriptional regulator